MYKNHKTPNHKTRHEFTQDSKVSLTSLTDNDFCTKTV